LSPALFLGGATAAWPLVSILASELNVKRLEILHEFVPQARRIAVLADPTTISSSAQLASAARNLGVEVAPFEAQDPDELSRGLDALIYDHQKAGPDVLDMAPKFSATCKEAGSTA
jgi:hypothetical protein